MEPENILSIRGDPPLPSTAYSFRADFKKLLDVAGREVKAKGLEGVPVGGDGYLFYKPIARSGRLPPMGMTPRLRLYRDTAYDRGLKIRRGWVTVLVHQPEQPTWLDNLRSFLGI